jgi:ribosome maturation factor RimP
VGSRPAFLFSEPWFWWSGKALSSVPADRADRIQRLIEPSLAGMGYDLVRLVISGRHSPTVQIMAERRDRGPMTVDDCAFVSRNLSAVLDVEDPFEGTYMLEVSSPGVDRPLVRREDFDRFAGQPARVEVREPLAGRRKFTGRLGGLRDGAVVVDCDGSTIEIAFDNIAKARLVVTDQRIAELMHQSKSG